MDDEGGTSNGDGPLDHRALIHRTPEQYLDGVLAFVGQGLKSGGPVIVVAPGDRLELIASKLNGSRAQVELVDISEHGLNPAWLIPSYQRRIAPHKGRHVHLVSEPLWAGRSPEEIEEVMIHEGLANVAFEGGSISVLCPFDGAELDPSVIAQVKRTHRLLARDGESTTSPDFAEEAGLERLNAPLRPLPGHGSCLEFSISKLGELRSRVAAQATAAELPQARRADVVFAVNELATNSIRHAGGSGELELWVMPERVVAEVRDHGRMDNPLVGRVNPDELLSEGLGLWMVNQMCDLVQIRSGRGGTTVRVHFKRGSAA